MMTVFWLILLFAILFVVGSATALNALGRSKTPGKDNKSDKDDQA